MVIEYMSHAAILRELRTFYQQHATHESLRCRVILMEYLENHIANGNEATLLLTGSLSFGQVVRRSDIDVLYIGSNLLQFKEDAAESLVKQFRTGNVHITYINIGVMDIHPIRQYIKNITEGNINFDRYAFIRFIREYWAYEPMTDYCESLYQEARSIAAKLGLMSPEDEILSITGVDRSHYMHSFLKYHTRLKSRAIKIPQRIRELEKTLLSSWG